MDASPLDRALARVGDRWTLLVVEALLDGPRRYSELAAALAGIAPNVLSARLKKLERDGLVLATPYSDRPRRYRYALTADGRDLGVVLTMLATWAAGADVGGGGAFHDACGTPLEARLWCPTCDTAVTDDGATSHL